jgi:hypothetical protein
MKGMMPMDMRLLLTSLEAIKCVCTHKKVELESSEMSSKKDKKGKKRPGTDSMAKAPKKVCFEKTATCARSMGARLPRTTLVSVIGMKKTKRRNLISTLLRRTERESRKPELCAADQEN